MTLNDEFSLKELTEQQEDIKEQDLKFSANFKLPFKNGNKLKFGAKVVRKTKDKDGGLLRIFSAGRRCFYGKQP